MNIKKQYQKFKNNQDFNPGLYSFLFSPFFFARRGLYKELKKLSHHLKGDLLDVGCGQKPYKKLFTRVTSYIGMDVEESGHDHTNEQIDVYYDGKVFPFLSETFDSVITNQVLEHVFNPNEFLKEIHRVMKPDGKLLLSVPFMWPEHEKPYDYARYSSFGLKHLLEINGFKIIKHHKTNSDIRTIFQILNCYINDFFTRFAIINIPLAMLIIFPSNLIGTVLKLVLPSSQDLFLDNVILAEKSIANKNI